MAHDQAIRAPASNVDYSPSPGPHTSDKAVIANVTEAGSTDRDTSLEQVRATTVEYTWQPSIFHIGPLSGLLALLFAFLQIFASYAVLQASDGTPITSWKYQPTVYLAILVAISNKALTFAVVKGTFPYIQSIYHG